MNKSTRWVILVGVTLFILSALYPPWVWTDRPSGGAFSLNDAGYHLIFSPPTHPDERDYHGIRLDLKRLGLEWVCIAVIAGTVLLFVRKS